MLNTIFKITGIVFFLLGILALFLMFYSEGFFCSPRDYSALKEAQSKAELSVIKAEKDGDKIIFLLNVKNDSDKDLNFYGLVINVVDENNKTIDKCSATSSEMVPRRASAKSGVTVLKIICKNMQLSTRYRGDVKYIPKFERMF